VNLHKTIRFSHGKKILRGIQLACCYIIVIGLAARLVVYSTTLYKDIYSFEQDILYEGEDEDENYDNEEGYAMKEYLPLWDWERDSIGLNSTPRVCKPPPGIPSMCCVGTTSAGGGPRWRGDECHRSDHMAAENWTKTYMKDIPYVSGRPCDICEIVHLLSKYNWTLALQGDSVTHQVWGGIICELARRGYPVSVHGEDMEDSRENNGYSKFSHWDEMTVTVANGTNVTMRYYRAYRSTNFLINRTLSENDIVVFDHGLHYPANRAAGLAKQDMLNLLEFAAQHWESNRVKLLAWRETTAQHFANIPGGYFLRSMTDPNNCSRISEVYTAEAYPAIRHMLDPSLLKILRNVYPRNVFYQAVESTTNFTWVDASDPNFLHTPPSPFEKELVFLPYRDYTKELVSLHHSECTHYCANPFVWQPIWRNVRLAIQRTAKYLPVT